MFDSHCHLDFPEFDGDRGASLAAARERGVQAWFVPGCFPEQWGRVAALVGEPGVSVGYGIHPWWAHVVGDRELVLEQLRRFLVEESAVALGECGLDGLRTDEAPAALQEELFEDQLKLACELEFPVVLHQVRARAEFLRCLSRVGLPRAGAVVHGFSGDRAWAQELVKRGCFLGVGPSVTRSQRRKLREALASVPLRTLLVETDAPDQAPAVEEADPRGGDERGKPADLARVVEVLAQITEKTVAEVAFTTTRTARQFFRVSP